MLIVSLSSRIFLLGSHERPRRLPVSAFHRLRVSQSTTRVPEFTNRRARTASVVVAVAVTVVLGLRRLDFDVRDFHDQVLLDGALPLTVLEAKIGRWIAAQRRQARHAHEPAG